MRPTPSQDLIVGRLSLRIAASAGAPERLWSADFELEGQAERGQLQLLSPLGTVVAQATWSPQAAELLAGGQSRSFPTLTELARQALGEPLPLQALPDWLRGRVWAGAPHRALDGGFEQSGWRVDAASLATGVVVIRRDSPPAVTLRALMEKRP